MTFMNWVEDEQANSIHENLGDIFPVGVKGFDYVTNSPSALREVPQRGSPMASSCIMR